MRAIARIVGAALAAITFGGAASAAPAPGVGELYRMSDAVSRSISPENVTGGKAQGARVPVEKGSARDAAQDLGTGWKVNPYVIIFPGNRLTLGEAEGPGVINHIWMTLGQPDYRSYILRIYWDGESTPSVEVPVGDFFAAGFGRDAAPVIDSAVVAVNSGSGLNSFWQMPFRKKFRIEIENRGKAPVPIYYQINYALQPVPKDAAYLHAQFRMVDRLKPKTDFTILDGVKGQGHYVGTYLTHSAFSPGWWGEGEVKFYMDGDTDHPTINTTGEEDYFLGSYGYRRPDAQKKLQEVDFSSLYAGFHVYNKTDMWTEYYMKDRERRIGEYRWHILDPVRFKSDLKVTIQALGWQGPPVRYLPLDDGFSSVAYWYQAEPHAAFPTLPDDATLAWKPLKTPKPK